MIDAWNSRGPNYGNIEAMTTAYGKGTPLDPMSGGIGNRHGMGWSPGAGQPAPGTGAYRGPVTGVVAPWAAAFTPGYGKDLDPVGYSNISSEAAN